MPSLRRLINKYPNNYVLQRYWNCTEESWSHGNYYLGGHIRMNPDDNISYYNIAQVQFIKSKQSSPANQWELPSIQRSYKDFGYFVETFDEYMRMTRFNGLLRAIVFWLSPARKRATEKVWHPDNLIIKEDEFGDSCLVPRNRS